LAVTSTNTSRALQGAIESLYVAFGQYQMPTTSTYCKHCVTDAEDKRLRSTPLKQLTQEDVARYSFKAISTWGTVEQFKHMLPRLFEIVATERYRYNPEVLFQKPRLGGLPTWPEPEQRALLNFCVALWQEALSHHPLIERLPSFASIDDCLCSIGQILDDLKPLLNSWNENTSSTATLHLVDFAIENACALREGRGLSNAFWDTRRVQMQQVAEWFLAQEFALALRDVEKATPMADFREDLRNAILRFRGQRN